MTVVAHYCFGYLPIFSQLKIYPGNSYSLINAVHCWKMPASQTILVPKSHQELKIKPYKKRIWFQSTTSIQLIEKQKQSHDLARLYGRPAWTHLSQTGGHGRHTQALCSLEVADGMSSRLLEGFFLSALLFKAIKTGFNSSSEPVMRQNTWTLHTQTGHFKQVNESGFSWESTLTVNSKH